MAGNQASFRQRSPIQRGLLIAALTALGAWGLELLGVLSAVDGAVQDALVRWKARWDSVTPQVLLVVVDDPTFESDESKWLESLEILRRHGARSIVWTMLPAAHLEEVYRAAYASRTVVFARPLVADSLEPWRLKPAPLPDALHRYPSPLGIHAQPPPEHGVCRTQHAAVELDDEVWPTVEAVTAEIHTGVEAPSRAARFGVTFRGGPGSLPKFEMERLLAEDLLPDLVADKCVLVGRRPSSFEAGLVTPTTPALTTMSLLEYSGHAINSLVCDLGYESAGSMVKISLLLLLALVGAFAYQILDVGVASWCFVGLAGVSPLLSGALLSGLNVWISPTAGCLVQVCLFTLSLRHKALKQALSTWRLIEDSTVQLREKYWPLHFYSSTASWTLATRMIHQTLDLNRMVLLELEPLSKQVRAIESLGCTLEDVTEKRRDVSRAPYADALKLDGAFRVKDFLQGGREGEDQYLLPLKSGGEVLGFWALAIDTGRAARMPNLHGLLAEYAASIGDLVRQGRREGERPTGGAAVAQALGRDPVDDSYEALSANVGLLQKRLLGMESLITRLESGVVVYDMFGRVQHINERMLALLNREGLAPFEMTGLDLILALSEYDLAKSRRLLRHVTAEGNVVSIAVSLRAQPRDRFVMHVKRLDEAGERDVGRAVVERLASRMILCEIFETTALTRLYELKSQLSERLRIKLRDDLATIEMTTSILGKQEIEADSRFELCGVIHERVESTVHALSDVHQYLSVNADADDLDRFPLDPRLPLDAVLEEAQAEAEGRRLELKVVRPYFASYVLGSSSKLEQLFRAILHLLFSDAAEQTAVLVELKETEEIIEFAFSNTGFGIPNELLQQYIFGVDTLSSDELASLRDGVRWVQAWGGSFAAESAIGMGHRFTVSLVKFF